MFRAIWSKSLRDYRVPILGWGAGLGLLMILGLVTATPAVLAAYVSLAPLFSFLGTPDALGTPEGYVTFRYLGLTAPILLSIWPILAGARLVRGEEERGTMDVLLATPQQRIRLLLEKLSALLLAMILIAMLVALGLIAGEANIQHVDVGRALLAGLNLSLLAFFFGTVALLFSQFTLSRGAAAGWAAGVMILAVLLDITGREVHGSWVQYLSPFYYYNFNKPLIPSFSDQPAGALVLVGLSVLCIVGSAVLFVRRDIGRSVFSWQRKGANGSQQAIRSLSRAERSLSTRSVSLRTLFAQGWPSFWWLLGMVFFCIALLLLTPSLQKPFYNAVQQTPWLQQFFFDTPTNTNAALLGTVIFTFMPALVVVLALVLALAWSADLENGRLELVFATPQARPRILLERFAVNVLVVVLAPVLVWLVIMIGAQAYNINVDQGRIAAASFTMLPPALITMGLVYALAGRLRYAALLSILTLYLVVAYLEESLEGSIQMPTWLMNLSIFHLYGNPVFLGMNWNNFLGMTAAALVLLVIGVAQFRYADLKSG